MSFSPLNSPRPFQGGMQVHAVPDDERALDAKGQPLPWGYAYADSSLNRKQPSEKGPFGRATNRRSLSRTKTATPGKEDPKRLENEKLIDDVFTRFKKDLEAQETKNPSSQKGPVTSLGLPHTRSAMDLNQTSSSSSAPSGPGVTTFKEPTEVLIYGYGGEYQYAAIEFFESASQGSIYEDYDRYPPNPRYSTFLSTSRPSIPRTLPQAAIRKINTYQGGDHWIKVTFDSPEAAERAIYFSPHIIHGYACHAEPWRGVGPNADVAITANAASARADTLRQRRPMQQGSGIERSSWSTMPPRIHTAPSYDLSSTSSTASSATATGVESYPLEPIQEGNSTPSSPQQQQYDPPQSQTNTDTSTKLRQRSQPPPAPLRIRGATRAILHPASSALLPVAPWSQRTFGDVPLLGSLFGGSATVKVGAGGVQGGIIGGMVPRRGDGTFDWEKASWYWRICWWMDGVFGTDLCGMRGEE